MESSKCFSARDFLYPVPPHYCHGADTDAAGHEDGVEAAVAVPEVLSLVGRRWKYRGEGGANLVRAIIVLKPRLIGKR